MPQLQIADFGEDPYSQSIGNFAEKFSSALFAAKEKKRNDEIFERIAKKYKDEPDHLKMLEDIQRSSGFDHDYKKNLISEVANLAEIAAKKEKSLYDQERLDIEREKLEQKKNQEKKDKSRSMIQTIDDFYRNEDEKLDADNKSYLADHMKFLIDEHNYSLNEAFQEAKEVLDIKNQLVKEEKVTERPVDPSWYQSGKKTTQDELEQLKLQAAKDLKKFYDNGVTIEKDLIQILQNSGWDEKESNEIIKEFNKTKKKKSKSKQSESIEDIFLGE